MPAALLPEKKEAAPEAYFPDPTLKHKPVALEETPSSKEQTSHDKERPQQGSTLLVESKEFHYELTTGIRDNSEEDKGIAHSIQPADVRSAINEEGTGFEKATGQKDFPPVQPLLNPKGNSVEAVFNYTEGSSTIKVFIGRIEVKAVAPESRPSKPAAAKRTHPAMSLDDYLKKRNTAE